MPGSLVARTCHREHLGAAVIGAARQVQAVVVPRQALPDRLRHRRKRIRPGPIPVESPTQSASAMPWCSAARAGRHAQAPPPPLNVVRDAHPHSASHSSVLRRTRDRRVGWRRQVAPSALAEQGGAPRGRGSSPHRRGVRRARLRPPPSPARHSGLSQVGACARQHSSAFAGCAEQGVGERGERAGSQPSRSSMRGPAEVQVARRAVAPIASSVFASGTAPPRATAEHEPEERAEDCVVAVLQHRLWWPP